jgi:phosphatidylserine/phosphatidylglycerophosphate/cardiolipin synthase-like enzyme
VVADGEIADVGSANFTPLSHGVYDEINVYVRDAAFARRIEAAVRAQCEGGIVADRRVPYRKFHFQVERAIVAYQARKGGRLQ